MDDKDALAQLVASEGWQMFVKHAHSQWSDSFVMQRFKAAVSGIPSGDEPSNHETARNLLAAQDAVLSLLNWPQHELDKLAKNQPPHGTESPVGWFKRAVGR